MSKINIRFGATPGEESAALQELSVARGKSDGTIYPNLRSRLDAHDASLAQIATNITNQTNIASAIALNAPLTLNIGKSVTITSNLTIPQNIILKFNNDGKIVINSGVTLTVEGIIEADYVRIFEFVDSTSVLTTTKYKGELKVDWFGADPYTTFSYDYTTTNGTPTGADSSDAFKRCMSFAQDSRYTIIKYRPYANYFVTGDNPCGLQKNINLSCFIKIEGNQSRIYWKPSQITDSLFGKLGLLHRSYLGYFDVITLGDIGSRNGTIFNTKLGFNNIHFFSKCIFESINVNVGNSIGCDKVFNFEPDGTHSQDDLSEFKNIKAVNFNTFVNLLNNESVKNTFINCYTASYTNNAKTFNIIAPLFSGYLSIIDHHFTAVNAGEVMLYTSEQQNAYPVYIERSRLEVKGEVLFAFCDIGSMDVYINGLSFILGGGVYNYDNNYFVIGQYARLTLERCMGVYGNIKLKERTVTTTLTDAVISKQSMFILKLFSTATLTQIGYPNIRYDSYADRTAAIVAGKIYKRVKVTDPNSTNDSYNLPVTYNSTGQIEYTDVTLTKFKVGKSSIVGSFNTPSDIVIESLILDVASFNAVDVNSIEISVYKATGAFIKTYTTTLVATTKVTSQLLTTGKYLALPHHSTISVTWKKDGVVVSNEDLFPQSKLQIKYRAIMASYETNGGFGGEVTIK